MFGSDVLDILLGLAFVYLLASLIVSAATELISGWLGWRADKLLDGIRNLVNSPGAEDWAQKLYGHPLIQGLSPLPTKVFIMGKFRLAPLPPGPSYIPARLFSSALISLIQNITPAISNMTKALQSALNAVSDPKASAADIKKAVLLIAGNIPITSPPSNIETRIKTDLQALAERIPDSDISISRLITGVESIVSRLSDSDWVQARWKNDLQNSIPSARPFSCTVDQLKNSLQALVDGISDYSALSLSITNDLQKLISGVPGTADSAAIATELVRAFVDITWDRYLADIIDQIPNDKLRTALGTLLQQSEGSFEKFKGAVETWFNDAMDRVSGWYKRHIQWVQVILGVALTFTLDLDSVLIVRALSTDNSGLLKATVSEAQRFAEESAAKAGPDNSPQSFPTPTAEGAPQPGTTPRANSSDPAETLRRLMTEFSALNVPVGWTTGATASNADFRQWPGWTWQRKGFLPWCQDWRDTITHHFVGWLLTIVAVSLGAPFWFDLLSRFISVRASGDPPQQLSKSQKDSGS
jgi:hypothetical protein